MGDPGGEKAPQSVARRQAEDEGTTNTSGTSEVTELDLGSLNDATTRFLHGAYLDVTLNSQTSVDLKLKVEINGSRTQIGSTVTVSSSGTVNLTDFGAGVPIANPHIRITATGADSSPTTEAAIDHTASYQEAS